MKYELNINGITLLNLCFAEDIVIISQFQEASKEISETLCNSRKRMGLQINVTKTKLLKNCTKTHIRIFNAEIKY